MKKIAVRTQGRTQFVDITGQVQSTVSEFGLKEGVVTVFFLTQPPASRSTSMPIPT